MSANLPGPQFVRPNCDSANFILLGADNEENHPGVQPDQSRLF